MVTGVDGLLGARVMRLVEMEYRKEQENATTQNHNIMGKTVLVATADISDVMRRRVGLVSWSLSVQTQVGTRNRL